MNLIYINERFHGYYIYSDTLYILQHFNLNFNPFSIVNTIVQHLRLDYCENFEIA